MDELLKESLEALKDIVNAADNGEPYSPQELTDMVLPILGRAYEAGIRLSGEELFRRGGLEQRRTFQYTLTPPKKEGS